MDNSYPGRNFPDTMTLPSLEYYGVVMLIKMLEVTMAEFRQSK